MERESYINRTKSGSETWLGDEHPSANNIIAVTGTTGAGKDFLLKRAFSQLGSSFPIQSALPVGELIAGTLQVHRDSLRDLTPGETVSLMHTATDIILPLAPCVINSHLVPIAQGEYIKNKEMMERLHAKHYVIVVADPKRVVEWKKRENDLGERNRTVVPAEEVKAHQRQVLDFVGNTAVRQRSNLTVIYNNPDAVMENVTLLADIIKSLYQDLCFTK